MSKYLYGASVQGIQDFIFKTNKLKEIIGASKIVESIDGVDKTYDIEADMQDEAIIKGIFDEYAKYFKEEYKLEDKPEIVLLVAGSIVLIVKNEKDLKKLVLEMPKKVMQKAYGITFSQAVVKYEDDYKDARARLEERLKIQRNKPSIPLDMHFSILECNPKTGRSLEEKYDIGTRQKVEAFENYANKDYKNQIFDIEKISNSKNKIAVIHADGNGLGNIVKDLNKNDTKGFSLRLDSATKKAFNEAVKEIKSKKYRKIILGGDDLTLVCDASYALEFTQSFLSEFERLTKENGDNLSACAGIAICHEKYPMHYALDLAEDLCSQAKKHTKENYKAEKVVPSCLMFHNIQSSSVKDFDKFIKDELSINNKRLDFGPYYLHVKDQPSIESFLETVKEFQKENSPKGRLREWLNDLKYDEIYAQNQLKRIEQMNNISGWESKNLRKLHVDLSLTNLFIEKDGYKKSPIYDILQIVAIKGGDK